LLRSNIESNPGPIVNKSECLKIITLNCRGLSDKAKLLKLIGKIKQVTKHFEHAVIALQETHHIDPELLKCTWVDEYYVSNGSTKARGVCLLFKNLKGNLIQSDNDGRYLICEVTIDKSPTIICNAYGPNDYKDAFKFYTSVCLNLSNLLSENEERKLIFLGDLNLHLDDERWSGAEAKVVKCVTDFTNAYEIQDTCQISTSANNFTWSRQTTFSRIDYILVSSSLLCKANKFKNIWNFIQTDHAMVSVELNLSSAPKRGNGYMKLSKLDICDADRIERIRDMLNTTIRDLPCDWNPHLILDFIKMKIRMEVSDIRREQRLSVNEIDRLKGEIQSIMDNGNLNNQIGPELQDLLTKLNKAEERESEILRIKAGVKWREQGEKSTKFFLNQIKTNQARSYLRELDTEHGMIENHEDLKEYIKTFYSNLYAAEEVDESRFESIFSASPMLSNEDRQFIGTDLSIEDIKQSLRTCKDSSPGLDAIPYSFYKVFAKQLLPILMNSWRYSIETGKLPVSQRTSCITIIPKKGKDLTKIGNWRPISVSSCDIKIITKALSIKVAKILPSVIDSSQAAYVPGRDINFNNRILSAALQHCSKNRLKYSIIGLDAKKAFDSVSHKYIFACLRAYGFPDSFINTVKLLYTELTSVVQVNGFLTDSFNIERGVKQGDSLSCSLFILAIDPLIRQVKQNSRIQELDLDHASVKVVAYADDIAVITRNKLRDINEVFKEYYSFSVASGLYLNADKTEILNLSAFDNRIISKIGYGTARYEVNHVSKTIICGNTLSTDESVRYKANVLDRIDQLTSILNLWSGRSLTPNGKMIIIKTFALSQITFSSQFITFKQKDIKKIEYICYRFLWNNKPERVKRTWLKNDKCAGGINGIDVESFIVAIKLKQFFKSYNNQILSYINDCVNVDEDIKLDCKPYLRRIVNHIANNLEPDNPANAEAVSTFPIKWFCKQGTKINDLINTSCTNWTIAHCYRGLTKASLYNKIKNLLPLNSRWMINRQWPIVQCPKIPISNVIKECNSVSSKEWQTLLKVILNKVEYVNTSAKHSVDISKPEEKITWHNIWQLKNPSLRAVRLKACYKDIFSNERRCKFGITNSSNCPICGEIETVHHQLFECRNAQRIWGGLNMLVDRPVNSYKDIITCTDCITVEIAKAVIIRKLIQIDRSENRTIASIFAEIRNQLIMESCILRNKVTTKKAVDSLIERINALL